MSTYELDYHPTAEDDLFAIFNMIENYAGTIIAERKLAEMERVTRGLTTYPYIGSTRDDLRAGLRAIPVADKGVISFVIDESKHTVRILCISYAGADWMARIRDRT